MNACHIKPNVQSRLFDHKAVELDFTVKPSASSRPNISNKILNDPDLDTVVEISALECYALYLNEDNPIKPAALRLVGEASATIREAGPDPCFSPYSHATLLDTDARNLLMARLELTIGNFRDLNLENALLSISYDNFMEILINGIRNSVISYQSFVSKTVAMSKKNIEKNLENLKTDVVNNFDRISQLELDLRNINESELNAKLEKNPNFDTLNSERITPFFFKWLKGLCRKSLKPRYETRTGESSLQLRNKNDTYMTILQILLNTIRTNLKV